MVRVLLCSSIQQITHPAYYHENAYALLGNREAAIADYTGCLELDVSPYTKQDAIDRTCGVEEEVEMIAHQFRPSGVPSRIQQTL